MLMLLSALVCASCSEVQPVTFQRQELTVRILPERHLLQGRAVFTVAGTLREAVFRLDPASRIAAVRAGDRAVAFSFRNGSLTFNPGRAIGTGPTVVTIDWEGTFQDRPAAAGSGEDPSAGVSTAISAEGTFLGGEAGWYPIPETVPLERITTVETPPGMEAITFGRLIARETGKGTNRSVWQERHPVEVLSLSAGAYRIERRTIDGIDLYSYLTAPNAGLSGTYLDAAAKYIRFYAKLFGPYPYEKFAVVENFLPTGYAFPSYTLLGGAVIRLPFIVETSLPHEIAHNWWGNGVLVDQEEGNWSEGLVTYVADYLLRELKSPREGKEYRGRLISDYSALVRHGEDFPLRRFETRTDAASRAIGYGKGAMVFHLVALQIGDRAFFDALRQVCSRRMYRKTAWSDLVRAFSHQSGMELDLEQWLDRSGGPRLSLSEVTARRAGAGWQVSGVIRQAMPIYKTGVPLRLETDRGISDERIVVDGTSTRFSLTSAAKPETLVLDPDNHLFRLLPQAELPPSVNRLKGSADLMVVVTPACRTDADALERFLGSLGRPDAPVVDVATLRPQDPGEHDVIFCGVPDRPDFRLPAGYGVTPAAVTAAGTGYRTRDGLLLVTARNPAAGERMAAWLVPQSAGALDRYGARITHYGTYGYLVFGEGRALAKGTFPLSQSVRIREVTDR